MQKTRLYLLEPLSFKCKKSSLATKSNILIPGVPYKSEQVQKLLCNRIISVGFFKPCHKGAYKSSLLPGIQWDRIWFQNIGVKSRNMICPGLLSHCETVICSGMSLCAYCVIISLVRIITICFPKKGEGNENEFVMPNTLRRFSSLFSL